MEMRRLLIIGYCVLGLSLLSCSNDDDGPAAKVNASASGIWTDERDGEQYGWVRYDGLDWMTENCRYDIGDDVNSTIYQDADEYQGYAALSQRNLARYGRLYTLAGAKAACPVGWRLPTDADWQRLEQALGMSSAEAESDDWRGNIAWSLLSVYDHTADLSLLLGGLYSAYWTVGSTPGWRYLGTYGYYWTDTPDLQKEGEYYYVRKLAYNRYSVCRESMEPSGYKLSVRFVRDAG